MVVGCEVLRDVALKLEQAGKEGDARRSQAYLPKLQSAFDELKRALESSSFT